MMYCGGEERYPSELDDFTFELMLGVLGKECMGLEIEEREEKQQKASESKLTMKDRFSAAKAEADKTNFWKPQEKSFDNGR